jgi:protein-S-isoprenylcysteine O-methyltransferase Ste14
MKNKVVAIILFFLFAYLIPLLGNIYLLFSIQVGVLFVFSIVLFLTQPPFSLAETKDTRSKDKLSIVGILGACYISQAFSVIEWAYFRESAQPFSFDFITLLGLFLMIGGTAFRIWCIRTLGRYFTATVQTQSDQKIITTGAYRLVRHPSYSGAFLAMVGSAVFLHAYVGIVVSALAMFAAYFYRIRHEEQTLVASFGEDYKAYQAKTKRIFPFIY